LDWIEFDTVDPGGDHADLSPFLDMVGDARVVGLGTCARGSSEIQRLKHRLIRLLAEERSFSDIVLEANLADVIRVNEYTLEGRGDPAEILPRYLYWGVSTEEVAELLRWMWRYNTSGRGRIALAGCDMQRIDHAAEIVVEQVRPIDPGFAETAETLYERVLEADRVHWLSGTGIQARFPVEEARCRRIRFSGFLRTADVTGHASLWGWAGGEDGTLAHDTLKSASPRGSTDWRQYAVEVDVPENADHVSLGCFLAGNGTAWFDGLAVEIDGTPWKDPERIDFDLATRDLTGFWVDPRNRATLDRSVTRTGRPSLRIEPAAPMAEFVTSDLEALTLAKLVLKDLEESGIAAKSRRALRCARAVVQTLEMRTGGGDVMRARSMAENIEWLLDKGDRVVFWSNNTMVARGGGHTGTFLTQRLGDDYLPVGFATEAGSFLAMAPDLDVGLRQHFYRAPPDESFEAYLLQAGCPRMLLDLRTVDSADPEWGFLNGRRPFRQVGATALSHEFFEQDIRTDFDLLFWVEKTRAAQCLPRSGP
jgi:erythromycin esterase-like protein